MTINLFKLDFITSRVNKHDIGVSPYMIKNTTETFTRSNVIFPYLQTRFKTGVIRLSTSCLYLCTVRFFIYGPCLPKCYKPSELWCLFPFHTALETSSVFIVFCPPVHRAQPLPGRHGQHRPLRRLFVLASCAATTYRYFSSTLPSLLCTRHSC